jgi:hypothetical protein
MAYTVTTGSKQKDDKGVQPFARMCVNGAHVGDECPNLREDVLLVQFFLNRLSGVQPRFRLPKLLPQEGIWDARTRAAVIQFQLAAGGKAVIDGRVDAPRHRFKGTISHLTYTIVLLNGQYARLYRGADPRNDPALPQALVEPLSMDYDEKWSYGGEGAAAG